MFDLLDFLEHLLADQLTLVVVLGLWLWGGRLEKLRVEGVA
jgi:hypothetical protein